MQHLMVVLRHLVSLLIRWPQWHSDDIANIAAFGKARGNVGVNFLKEKFPQVHVFLAMIMTSLLRKGAIKRCSKSGGKNYGNINKS